MSGQIKLQFVGDDRVILADEVDLARDSEYIENLFATRIKEGGTIRCNLQLLGITNEILEIVVKRGSWKGEISKNTIRSLIVAADQFGMADLQGILAATIVADTSKILVSSDNVLDLWLLSRTQSQASSKCITKALEKYIQDNLIKEIMHERSFLNLDSESLLLILGWDLSIPLFFWHQQRRKVFMAIKLWINHDYEERVQHYANLLCRYPFDWSNDQHFLETQVKSFSDTQEVQDYVARFRVEPTSYTWLVGIYIVVCVVVACSNIKKG